MKPSLIRFALVVLVAGGAACGDEDFPTLSLTTHERFAASLTGQAERPNPVTTTASGDLQLELRDLNDTARANDVVRFELFVSGIDSVTQAHIHAGDANTAGDIMVFLFGPVTGTARGFTGVLRQGDITRTTSFLSPFTFDSLVTRIRAGTAYGNVHTRRNLGGEIRGQLAPAN